MTKREYDSLYGTTKDALGHKLYVGDLIVCCCYGNTAKLYIVKKICNIRILAVRADNKTWDNYFIISIFISRHIIIYGSISKRSSFHPQQSL